MILRGSVPECGGREARAVGFGDTALFAGEIRGEKTATLAAISETRCFIPLGLAASRSELRSALSRVSESGVVEARLPLPLCHRTPGRFATEEARPPSVTPPEPASPPHADNRRDQSPVICRARTRKPPPQTFSQRQLAHLPVKCSLRFRSAFKAG